MIIVLSGGGRSWRVRGQYWMPSWKKNYDIRIEKVPLFYSNTINRTMKSTIMIFLISPFPPHGLRFNATTVRLKFHLSSHRGHPNR